MDHVHVVYVISLKLTSQACLFGNLCFFTCWLFKWKLLLLLIISPGFSHLLGETTNLFLASQMISSSPPVDTDVSESLLWQHFSGLVFRVLSSLPEDIVNFHHLQKTETRVRSANRANRLLFISTRVSVFGSTSVVSIFGRYARGSRRGAVQRFDWGKAQRLIYIYIAYSCPWKISLCLLMMMEDGDVRFLFFKIWWVLDCFWLCIYMVLNNAGFVVVVWFLLTVFVLISWNYLKN